MSQSQWLKNRVRREVFESGMKGMTVNEFKEKLVADDAPPFHHGQVSSAFSMMHADGVLARLVERRNGSSIYVDSLWTFERPTHLHPSVVKAERRAELISAVDDVRAVYGQPLRLGSQPALQNLLDVIERQIDRQPDE